MLTGNLNSLAIYRIVPFSINLSDPSANFEVIILLDAKYLEIETRYSYSGRLIESRIIMIYRLMSLLITFNDPNSEFKGKPLDDVEYLGNYTRQLLWNVNRSSYTVYRMAPCSMTCP